MKNLNYKELELIVTELNQLGGAVLQKVGVQGASVFLSFWRDDLGLKTWCLQVKQGAPLLVELSRPPKKSKEEKPISLFLKKYFVGAQLVFVRLAPPVERLVFFEFVIDDLEVSLEFRLIPTAVNLIAQAGEKRISFFKVKELPKPKGATVEMIARPLNEIYNLYSDPKKKSSSTEKKINLSDRLKKLKKSLKKIETEEENKKSKIEKLRKLGLELKSKQSLAVDPDFLVFLDLELGVFENINRVYERLKKEQKKLLGLKERQLVLADELQKTESGELEARPSFNQNISTKLNIRKGKKIDFKTEVLPTGERLLIGKTAKGNMELIRAAKPWFIWFHLRDYPSCHGILAIEKKQVPTQDLLREVGRRLVQSNFLKKKQKYEGIKFDIIFCEVRYVRPLKSSVGKVNYTNDKNILVQM